MKAYFRCNDGHYFQGTHCPFDGWSSPGSQELVLALRALDGQGQVPSISALREAGMSQEALGRVIIVEFGNNSSVFEAVTPELYVIGGVVRKLRDLGREFN